MATCQAFASWAFFSVKTIINNKAHYFFQIVFAVVLALAAATKDKGGDMDHYGYPVSYAPVYETKAVDSYSYDLPQYKYESSYETYMPVMKYIKVKSVPFYGPSKAFYPKHYGGGYHFGGGGMGYY